MTSISRYVGPRPKYQDFCPGCGQQFEHTGFGDTTPLVRHKDERGAWCKQVQK